MSTAEDVLDLEGHQRSALRGRLERGGGEHLSTADDRAELLDEPWSLYLGDLEGALHAPIKRLEETLVGEADGSW